MGWALQIADSVAVITFTSPEDALLTLAEISELAQLLDTASAPRDEVSVVMLTAPAGRFVPDVDPDELTRSSEDVEDQLARAHEREGASGDLFAWDNAVEALTSMPQPTVAAIDGRAAGGGCLLALACTLRVASEQSVFGPVEHNLGVVGTDSSPHLVRLVGPALAAELLLSGRELDAEAAKQGGLISAVLPSKGFAAQARQWSERLAALPASTVFAVKQAVEGSTGVSRDDLLASQPPGSYLRAVTR